MASTKRYGERVSTAIRFERDVIDRLRLVAEERDVSVNLLVNSAVASWLGRQSLTVSATVDTSSYVPEAVQPFVQSNTLDNQKARPRQVEPRFKKGAK
jgi:hypothetical protein